MIALVGLGRMGLGVCARLVQSGLAVLATDKDSGRRSCAEAVGAEWAGSSLAAAAGADVVMTVLPGSPEVQSVMSDVLPAMTPGSAWIDLTSTSPRVAAQLRALAGGVECLDAPMGGGPDAARQGALELFVGGEPDTIERHRAILEALGRVHAVGRPGAGQIVKLLVNLLWFGQAVATAEALLLARRAGLDVSLVRGALTHSAADARFMHSDLDKLLDGDYLTSFGLDRCCEELAAITELAHDLEVPFELSMAVGDIYNRALERYGDRDGELLAVALLEEMAGITLRR